MTTAPSKDLVVLTADKNIKFAIEGLLTRTASLKIRKIKADVHSLVQHDPGCLKSHDYLRRFQRDHYYALVIFDLEGCGEENKKNKTAIVMGIEKNLHDSGWGDRAVAIVIDPELETWVWSNSKHVDSVLGWKDKKTSLKDWLRKEDFLRNKQIKPDRPKEALEAVLRKIQKPRSSALYQELAEKVSLEGCSDEAFNKLKLTLQKWFPA